MIGQTISRYHVLEKCGEGAAGVVYKARDLTLERFVALKFLSARFATDDTGKQRFIHEAQAASALDHPNICSIYEIDEEAAGPLFIVMAYYEGETLQRKVISKPLSVNDAIAVAIQLAQGLAKAHAHGIVHRDLKPANVIVTNDGVVKILDFGVAKLAGKERLTRTGATLGTAAYMSPEQVRGEKNVDHRADIWALGVMLYEMITAQLPFKGEYEHETMYAVLEREAPRLTALCANAPTELERIILRAVEKNPARRYQRMQEMLGDLKTLAREIESGARPENASPLAQSNRRFIWAASLMALAMTLGFYFKPTTAPPALYDSIAVLPLENLSGDPEQEYFADGMTEALISDLAQISALRVISRTSVMRYKESRKPLPEIARELKVKAVLEGTVQRAKERVKITAQLIDAATDRHLWAKSYERELHDILALQSEVARAVAHEIKIKLTPAEQARLTSSRAILPEAHLAYLKGRFYWNKYTKSGFLQAIDQFQQALAIDSSSALAYAGLADAYMQLAVEGFMPPHEVMPHAEAAALQALRRDEAQAEAHLSWGVYNLFYAWNRAEAEKGLQRAIALNPNHADARHFLGHYLQSVGQVEAAIEEVETALALDPLSLIINAELGWAYYWARQYDRAIAQFQKTVAMDSNFSFAYWGLAHAYLETERHDAAIANLEHAVALARDWPVVIAELGYAYARSGNNIRARQILTQLQKRAEQEYVDPVLVANIYLALGEKDRACDWLEKGYAERACVWMIWLKVDPKYDSLRANPRFTALLEKMGLE